MLSTIDKTAILRKYETYCFQVSYYMLENEKLALEAATQAFIHIYRQDAFFSMGEQEQEAYIKRYAIRQSLIVHSQSLSPRNCQHVS